MQSNAFPLPPTTERATLIYTELKVPDPELTAEECDRAHWKRDLLLYNIRELATDSVLRDALLGFPDDLHFLYVEMLLKVGFTGRWRPDGRTVDALEVCRQQDKHETHEGLFYKHGGIKAVVGLAMADRAIFSILDKMRADKNLADRLIKMIENIAKHSVCKELELWIQRFVDSPFSTVRHPHPFLPRANRHKTKRSSLNESQEPGLEE